MSDKLFSIIKKYEWESDFKATIQSVREFDVIVLDEYCN